MSHVAYYADLLLNADNQDNSDGDGDGDGGSWRLVIKLNFCSDFEHKGWSRFRCWSLGEILKLEFVQHFAADVKVIKLNLGRDSEARFGQDFEF